MKRRRDNILNQPIIKKPDINASTDLRSKIGAKLQTLFLANRVETLRRRQAFLLGEPQHHSEIIIDPNKVVKTEAPETEECNLGSVIDSPNFLSSAKSRITELLNKQQCGTSKYKNSEKENSNSSSECHSTSSVNSATSSSETLQNQTSCYQSISYSSLNKRKKLTNNKNNPDASSDGSNNPTLMKNMVVVVEDVMKNRTRRNHSLSNKSIYETSSSESCFKNKNSSVSKQRRNKAAKDNVANEVFNSSTSCDTDSCIVIGGSSTSLSQSCISLNSSDSVKLNGNNSAFNTSKSKSTDNLKKSSSNDSGLILDVMDLGEILIDTEEPSVLCSNHNEDDCELVDDPDSLNKVDGNNSLSSSSLISSNESHDPDVVLLCVKQPTHEVITLEDGDESDDIVEEVQKCPQCGKAFRAKSLLNFHIRMHGNDVSSNSKSSSVR